MKPLEGVVDDEEFGVGDDLEAGVRADPAQVVGRFADVPSSVVERELSQRQLAEPVHRFEVVPGSFQLATLLVPLDRGGRDPFRLVKKQKCVSTP